MMEFNWSIEVSFVFRTNQLLWKKIEKTCEHKVENKIAFRC